MANPQSESLGYWVFKLNRAMYSRFSQRVNSLGVSTPDWTALSEISQGNVTPLSLARYMGVDRATVTRMLDQLEKKGLIQRTPNPGDGRSILLKLTTQGSEFLPRLVAISRETNQLFRSLLCQHEARELLNLLRRIGQRLDQLTPSARLPEKPPEPVVAVPGLLQVQAAGLWRDSLKALLEQSREVRVLGQASTPGQAQSLYAELDPEVTLIVNEPPLLSAAQVMEPILRVSSAAKLVVVGSDLGHQVPPHCLHLSPQTRAEELVAAIRSLAPTRSGYQQSSLTQRELLILRALARGLRNKQIALDLGVSHETIKTHLRNLFEKLQVSDRLAAVTRGVQNGLLRLD